MNMDTLADMDTVLDNMADIVDTGKFGYDVILASRFCPRVYATIHCTGIWIYLSIRISVRYPSIHQAECLDTSFVWRMDTGIRQMLSDSYIHLRALVHTSLRKDV